MTDRRSAEQQRMLENCLRRFGISGKAAFDILAYHYTLCYADKLKDLPRTVRDKWLREYQKIRRHRHIVSLLDELVLEDSEGSRLSEWYQFFVGRQFREASGKFFTPREIASAMARMLPKRSGAVIMDPACGSGTFLIEASKIWREDDCVLVANDIDPSLVELTMLTLSLATPPRHRKVFINTDMFVPSEEFGSWYGRVDYILANPPFSLRIDYEQFDSPLFSSGYRNSDALFVDVALELLRPGGRLITLLPHSIIANKEFSKFRSVVETLWVVLGVICLPEGVFQSSAGTTTRADIVILEKKQVSGTQIPRRRVFASVPSVGIGLNNNRKGVEENYLEVVLNTPLVRQTLGIGSEGE